MAKLTDESIITFGKHQGEKLINVPADYLIYLHENGKCPPDIREYIEDNMAILVDEKKRDIFNKINRKP